MIRIDGSQGGGQILRSSLTLSLITGKPFYIKQIRGQRPKPGLKRQHLTCVQAAMEISGGSADGHALESQELIFHPGKVRAGNYHIRISTAGSTTLVFQTILLPLLLADKQSVVVIEGGTHNPMAPPVDFLEAVYLPILHAMGAQVCLSMDRHGFAPAGGGQITARVRPSALTPVDLLERGVLESISGRVLSAHLDLSVAKREVAAITKLLGVEKDAVEVKVITDSAGPGNAVLIDGRWAQGRELVIAYGERGRSGEVVVRDAVKDFTRYKNATAPVGRCLADQLLLPFAVAGGGSFRTLPLSNHFETNRSVIEAFLPVRIETTEESRSSVLVEIRAR